MITFNVNVDLDKVNKTSLLFESGEEIANLRVGKYCLSLMCRGEVNIFWKDEKYKYASNYPKELTDLLLSNTDWSNNEDLYIDNNNWFEFELLEENENKKDLNYWNYVEGINDYSDVADIEGTLNDEENSKSIMLYKIMVDYLKELKNHFSEELKDLDLTNL